MNNSAIRVFAKNLSFKKVLEKLLPKAQHPTIAPIKSGVPPIDPHEESLGGITNNTGSAA